MECEDRQSIVLTPVRRLALGNTATICSSLWRFLDMSSSSSPPLQDHTPKISLVCFGTGFGFLGHQLKPPHRVCISAKLSEAWMAAPVFLLSRFA